VIVNKGEVVWPAATVIGVGTVTPPPLLDRSTGTPPAGAGPLRVILLDVVETPPTTAAGESVTDNSATGFTVSVALFDIPL